MLHGCRGAQRSPPRPEGVRLLTSCATLVIGGLRHRFDAIRANHAPPTGLMVGALLLVAGCGKLSPGRIGGVGPLVPPDMSVSAHRDKAHRGDVHSACTCTEVELLDGLL